MFRNKYVYTCTCMHAITMEKRLNLKASGERGNRLVHRLYGMIIFSIVIPFSKMIVAALKLASTSFKP